MTRMGGEVGYREKRERVEVRYHARQDKKNKEIQVGKAENKADKWR